MCCNKLKLNENKTEAVLFSSRHQVSMFDELSSVRIGTCPVKITSSVRLTMSGHVSTVTSSASFAMRNISKIRKYLDRHTTEKLVHAFVSSRLDYHDYCNGLCVGISNRDLARLQRVQNTAHWLPIKQRFQFKIALLTYKSLHGRCPSYISELVSEYVPSRTIRSTSLGLLAPHRHRTSQLMPQRSGTLSHWTFVNPVH